MMTHGLRKRSATLPCMPKLGSDKPFCEVVVSWAGPKHSRCFFSCVNYSQRLLAIGWGSRMAGPSACGFVTCSGCTCSGLMTKTQKSHGWAPAVPDCLPSLSPSWVVGAASAMAQ